MPRVRKVMMECSVVPQEARVCLAKHTLAKFHFGSSALFQGVDNSHTE